MSPRLIVTTGAPRGLVAVLVQPELGTGGVEVHDRGVGPVGVGGPVGAEVAATARRAERDHLGAAAA